MIFRVWSLLAFVTLARGVTVPSGTELQLRLTTEASSEKPSGQPVSAVLIVPVFAGQTPAIAAGAILDGTTADARAAKAGTDQAQEAPATLRLEFTKIRDAQGKEQGALSGIVASVDNARESVDNSGLITGITASQTIDARIDQGLNKLAARNQSLGQLLSTVKGAIVKGADPSVDFKPGVELTFKLTKDLNWNSTAPPEAVGAIQPADALSALVNSQPSRTVAEKPPNPSDLTNLMFLGTEEQLRSAFQNAGWFPSDKLSPNSKVETARAIIENRGYSEAPMSVLFLDNKPPDLTFQKQNDTFEKRHHIRIWRRPVAFNGVPVWVAAATHDISITFSNTSHSFTHGIDPDIDKERSKVVNDLVFTKQVHGLALVQRSGIPPNISNATGDKLQTDGSMAVLQF